MFGGSPMRVAVPPTLDAKTSGDFNRDGDDEEHRRHVIEEGRSDGRDKHQDRSEDDDVSSCDLIGLVGEPLEDPRLLHDPHNDHHGHQQEDDVHVDGLPGVLEADDPVLREEGPRRIGHRQHEGCSQESRQRPMHQLEGDEGIDDQENYGGNPESWGDGPRQTHVLMS
jgi:hypothetical protein